MSGRPGRALGAGVSEANPRKIAINECAPAGARGDPATPAGVHIVVLLPPGGRFAHFRLSAFGRAGAVTLLYLRNRVLRPSSALFYRYLLFPSASLSEAPE